MRMAATHRLRTLFFGLSFFTEGYDGREMKLPMFWPIGVSKSSSSSSFVVVVVGGRYRGKSEGEKVATVDYEAIPKHRW
jgi:hypothetical protein